MKKIKIIIPVIIFLGFLVLAPNLIWLFNSTATIVNEDKKEITSAIIYVDEKEVRIGNFKPGQEKLVFLPKSGDSTFRVVFSYDNKYLNACNEYVEGEMYHVEVKLNSKDNSDCSVSLPIDSQLFITKFLRSL